MHRQRRFLNVIAAVDAARESHPELGVPLTWSALQRVLAREQIAVIKLPIAVNAYVLGNDGTYVITVRAGLAARHQTRVIAHEYAHIHLHLTERGEVPRETSTCERGDPREYEAELFALLLRLGPTATPDHPDVAKLVARLESPAHRARLPQQLPLELPERLPTYKELPQPFQHEREYERKLIARGAANLRPKGQRIFRDTPTHDDERRIKWHDATKGTTRYEDIAGRHWWIYNFRKAAPGVSPSWTKVSDFMDPAITHRLFVNASGVRRLYRFANAREQRAYRTRHLDRQLAQAKVLPATVRRPRTDARRSSTDPSRGAPP